MHSAVVFAAFGAIGLVDATQTYDYITVGGGATGLVVANRLTEDFNSVSVRKTYRITASN
jgi:hypothetical protein